MDEYCDTLVAAELNAEIPNLLIPGDVEISSDAVSVGKTRGHSHGKHHLLLLAATFSDPRTGLTRDRCLEGFTTGAAESGIVTAEWFLQFLALDPWSLTPSLLASRIAAWPADGAMVKGGPSDVHPTTNSVGLVLQRLRRCIQGTWDGIHRWNIANTRILKTHDMVPKFLELQTVLADSFAAGQGLELAREVSEYMAEANFLDKESLGSSSSASRGQYRVPCKPIAIRMRSNTTNKALRPMVYFRIPKVPWSFNHVTRARMITYLEKLPRAFLDGYAQTYGSIVTRMHRRGRIAKNSIVFKLPSDRKV